MKFSNQKGVGMLEILISLLILAIAVLGFAVMQLRAVEATVEGFNRVQAMSIARDLAEKMRLNQTAISHYVTEANQTYSTIPTPACYTSSCTPENKAKSDVNETQLRLESAGMTMAMAKCEGIANGRYCIYIAWDKTEPKHDTSGSSDTACTVGSGSFSYKDNAQCVVVEAY